MDPTNPTPASAPPPDSPTPALMITDTMTATFASGRQALHAWTQANLKKDVDWGVITIGGKPSKPVLFKPGAEKVCILFGWRPTFHVDHETLDALGHPPGTIAYVCTLLTEEYEGPTLEHESEIHTHRIIGEGRGAASMSERSGSMSTNNVLKMCEKRALVDAVLRAAGLSEQFTQDLEDEGQGGPRIDRRPAEEKRATGSVPRSNDQVRLQRLTSEERMTILAAVEAAREKARVPDEKLFLVIREMFGGDKDGLLDLTVDQARKLVAQLRQVATTRGAKEDFLD